MIKATVLSEYNTRAVGNHTCGEDPSPQCVSQMPGCPQALAGKEERNTLSRVDTGGPMDEAPRGEKFQGSCQEMFSLLFHAAVF